MSHHARTSLVALLALLVTACASGGDAGDGPASRARADGGFPWRRDTAAETLAALEQRLLAAPRVALAYEITAEGALAARLAGTLELRGPAEVALSGDGDFGRRDVALGLTSRDGVLVRRSGERTLDGPVPPALRESLVIGLLRMGLLHNLARLTGGAAPDHAEGGVAGWVRVVDPSFGEPEGGLPSLDFSIEVDGRPVGHGRLLVDPFSGVPVSRTQTVHFPQGDMRVVESYTRMTVWK